MNDDDDIRREIKNLFVRTNMLISRFHRCSVNVKLTLFKTFGLCVHDTALWKYFVPLLTVNLSLHIINV